MLGLGLIKQGELCLCSGAVPIHSRHAPILDGVVASGLRKSGSFHVCFGCQLAAACCRYKNQDDARDTFKTLRSQHIGDRSALLYYEWAALEQLAGHASKAAAVLSKGLREAAAPAGWVRGLGWVFGFKASVYDDGGS